MAASNGGNLIFDCFCKPCVHKEKYYELRKVYTGQTHAVVKYRIKNADGEHPGTDTFHEESRNREHVEEKVIRKLKSKLTDYRLTKQKKTPAKMIVKIYISFSPCSGCSNKIMEFKEEQGKNQTEVEMTVVLANLYSVRRPSCMRSCTDSDEKYCLPHILYDYITVDSESTREQKTEEKKKVSNCVTVEKAMENERNSKDNIEGLKRMKEKGITMRTFCPRDWNFLLTFLFLRDPETEEGRKLKEQGLRAVKAREQEDVRMEQDLTDLLSEDGSDEESEEELTAGMGGLSVYDSAKDGAKPSH